MNSSIQSVSKNYRLRKSMVADKSIQERERKLKIEEQTVVWELREKADAARHQRSLEKIKVLTFMFGVLFVTCVCVCVRQLLGSFSAGGKESGKQYHSERSNGDRWLFGWQSV